MKKLWNDWSGPVAFTLGWTLLLAAALLMPNVPVWADHGGGIGNPAACVVSTTGVCDSGCRFHLTNECGGTHVGCKFTHQTENDCEFCKCKETWVQINPEPAPKTHICSCIH